MESDRCLRIGYGHWPPYSIYSEEGPAGVMKPVLQVLAQELNFCYEFLRVSEGGWGTQLANGSWTGMMGMSHRGEIDLALGPLGISEERAAVIDLSVPLFVDQQVIAYARPRLQPDLAGFIKPFTPLIWLMIGLAGFLVTVSGWFLLLAFGGRHLSPGTTGGAPIPSSGQDRPLATVWWTGIGEERGSGPWKRMNQVIFWTYGVLLTQSLAWFPSSNTGRTLGGFWLLSAFIIATVYRSSLKAMIIIPKVSLPFNNLEELIEQSEVPYIFIGGGLVYSTFKTADESSLFGRAWSRRAGAAWTYQDGLRMILHEGHAIVIDQTTILSILHGSFSKTSTCPLWMTRDVIMSYMLSLGFPKGAALKARVDPLVRRMREYGLLSYWMRQELLNSTFCLTPPGSEPIEERSLELQDFYGVFSLYAIGVGLSVLVFVLEIFCALGSRAKD